MSRRQEPASESSGSGRGGYHPLIAQRERLKMARLVEERRPASRDELEELVIALKGPDGFLPESPPETDLERAQQLVCEACLGPEQHQRRLALQALEICPDCADAFYLLGCLAESPQAMGEMIAKSLQAAERAFQACAAPSRLGSISLTLEGAAYLRAALEAALWVWGDGDLERAESHLRLALERDPKDYERLASWLAILLLEQGRDDEYAALAKQHPDETVFGLYNRVLWSFRQAGGDFVTEACLYQALEANALVPLYLVGPDMVTEEDIERMEGDHEGAAAYAAAAGNAWFRSPDALVWLMNTMFQSEATEIVLSKKKRR